MRSSVTVILNNPPVETNMSYPDYNPSVEDHQCLLVVVKQIGNQLKQKAFNYLFDRISRLQYVRIQDSQGSGSRGIWVRYKRSYAMENNEWGDFQAHRKVLGLICIGKCTNQLELDSLCRAHEATKEKYNSTLYDSRCLVYGYIQTPSPVDATDDKPKPNSEDENCSGEPSLQRLDETIERDSGVFSSPPLDSDVENETKQPERFQNGLSDVVRDAMLDPASGDPVRAEFELKKGHFRNISLPTSPSRAYIGGNSGKQNLNFSLPPSPTCSRGYSSSSESSSNSSSQQHLASSSTTLKSQMLFYPSVEECSTLENDLSDFISSLFWVLESKRLNKSHEKLDRVPFLLAPCEKKDFVGLNLENRTNKRRSQGRMKKHIGDLSFLAGLPIEAINCYSAAADILKSVSDWLWLAGCYEGLCAASAVTMFPQHHRKSISLQRNLSFTAGSNNKSRSGSISSHSLPNGMDPLEFKCKNCLSPDEIISKYREAIIHYSKYHNATTIEMEANIKATKILITQRRYLLASEFIQNLVFVKGQQSDEEKIQRWLCLSQLYTQIGFHRKAALFRRTAALRCVNSQTSDPNWAQNCNGFLRRWRNLRTAKYPTPQASIAYVLTTCDKRVKDSAMRQCYYLLLQALCGYKLSIDPKQYSRAKGWPILQIHMLKDLTNISRRMGNAAVSIRHMTFLLHNLFDHLTLGERREYCDQLSVLTSKCDLAPVPLILDNGYVLPTVNLTNLPRVKLFKPENLAPHLRPRTMVVKPSDKSPSGPFIFSPLQFGQRKEKDPNCNKMDFKWIEGDACEVALHIYNPLNFELKVRNMALLPNDKMAFETFPASLVLPAMSGPYPVNLVGTPHSTGNLEIMGYSADVFGVKSNCRLSELPSIKKNSYVIEVVPALPEIQVVTSLPKAATFSSFGDTSCIVTSVTLSLYAGAQKECIISLLNSSKQQNVEVVEVELESKLDKEFEKEFFKLNLDDFRAHLPLKPTDTANFILEVHAVGDLLALAKSYPDEDVKEDKSENTLTVPMKTPRTSSIGSLTSTVRSSINYSSFRRKITSETTQPPSPAPPPSSPFPQQQIFTPRVIEFMLRIRYSGGPGLKANYCRHSTVAVNIEVSPSILITKWDVLPAERPTHCYLVLDILNPTEYEMEVQYATNKKILIEAKETCRIPVPVERCPTTKISDGVNEDAARVCARHLGHLVNLKWTIASTESSGNTSVANLVWTPAMLDLIQMSPIQWEISLNDTLFKPEVEFNFMLGEVVNLTIAITNYSDTVLNNLYLKIDCYQDYQNGQQNFRLENKLAVIGCDYFSIPEINKQDTYSHHCGLLFFVAGVFKLDIQCSSGPLTRTKSNSISSAQEISTNSKVQSNHTWKCMRAIELTITQK